MVVGGFRSFHVLVLTHVITVVTLNLCAKLNFFRVYLLVFK